MLCVCGTSVLGGCGAEKERKPPPTISIVILQGHNAYLLDGQRVKRQTLEARLQRLADSYRRELTGNSRAYVRISAKEDNARNHREKRRIMEYCMKIGLDKVALF